MVINSQELWSDWLISGVFALHLPEDTSLNHCVQNYVIVFVFNFVNDQVWPSVQDTPLLDCLARRATFTTHASYSLQSE